MPNASANPFQDLIDQCDGDPKKIAEAYKEHRTNYVERQRELLKSPGFQGAEPDEILAQVLDKTKSPRYEDTRHCLVFWARPTTVIKELIGKIQACLQNDLPHMWFTPEENLHMTTLEITQSKQPHEIDSLVKQLMPFAEQISDYTVNHRARLVRPLLSFDAKAIALTFLPAVGEGRRSLEEDAYTYQHLRRDLWDFAATVGVPARGRYVAPSAHITIGRFITNKDFEDDDGIFEPAKVKELLKTIDVLNSDLKNGYWPEIEEMKTAGEWIVGEEQGLDFHRGNLWYGGGQEIMVGRSSA